MAFHDLPEEAFPLQLTAYVVDSEPLFDLTINAYEVVEIPANPEYAGRVAIRYRLASGQEVWTGPMAEKEAEEYIERRVQESAD